MSDEFTCTFFDLDATGSNEIDSVLSAICSAADEYRDLSDWTSVERYGVSAVEVIQNAVNKAAQKLILAQEIIEAYAHDGNWSSSDPTKWTATQDGRNLAREFLK